MDLSKLYDLTENEQQHRNLKRLGSKELKELLKKAIDFGEELYDIILYILISAGRVVPLAEYTDDEVDSLSQAVFDKYDEIMNDAWYTEDDIPIRSFAEEQRIYGRLVKKFEALCKSEAAEAFFSIPYEYAIPSLLRRFHDDIVLFYSWEMLLEDYESILADDGEAYTHDDWAGFRAQVDFRLDIFYINILMQVLEQRKMLLREQLKQRVSNMNIEQRAAYDVYMAHKDDLLERAGDFFKRKKICVAAYFKYLNIFTGEKLPDNYAIEIEAKRLLREYNSVRSSAYYWDMNEWKKEYDELLAFDEYEFELDEVRYALEDIKDEIMGYKPYIDELEVEGERIAEEVKKQKSAKDWQTFKTVAFGAFVLVGGLTSAFSVSSSFGSTPNPSFGEQWLNKSTGEIFDYDPRND